MTGDCWYHFVGTTLRDGRPVPADGVWLEHHGEISLGRAGLHASRTVLDALQYAPGPILCRVALAGARIDDTDKSVAQRRRILARIDATALLRDFARHCAREVLPLWDAPEVVRRYLETGDETLRAAARATVWTIGDAAGDAAGAKQRVWLDAAAEAAFTAAESR